MPQTHLVEFKALQAEVLVLIGSIFPVGQKVRQEVIVKFVVLILGSLMSFSASAAEFSCSIAYGNLGINGPATVRSVSLDDDKAIDEKILPLDGTPFEGHLEVELRVKYRINKVLQVKATTLVDESQYITEGLAAGRISLLTRVSPPNRNLTIHCEPMQ